MWDIWAKQLLPKALKTCPKCNKSSNLVTLVCIYEPMIISSCTNKADSPYLCKSTTNPLSGPWCGQVVNVLAFNSDDPGLNAADALSFFCKLLFEKNKYKQKEAGVGPFKKILCLTRSFLDIKHYLYE